MTATFLSIRSIARNYGSVIAVEDVSLEIAKGEFVTFLGPSGSGKSTTLYVIAGFQDPSMGDVLLQGSSLLSMPSNKRNIGMVFQRYTLFPHLSVAKNVAFPLVVRRRSKSEIDERVAAMLKLVRLERYADRMPAQLSGGQQQRVALARALAYDPPLLLMDEPLSALDKKLREEIQYEIKRVHNETGVTILYVTHDQEEALRLSDRIALFNNGRIEQVGSGRDLYETPATRFAAGFIGDSNFLPGTVTKVAGDEIEVQLPDGTLLRGLPGKDRKAGEDIAIMVRPDRITIASPSDGHPLTKLAATVVGTTFLGDTIHVQARTAWGEGISVRMPCNSRFADIPEPPGLIQLAWPVESSRVFASSEGK